MNRLLVVFLLTPLLLGGCATYNLAEICDLKENQSPSMHSNGNPVEKASLLAYITGLSAGVAKLATNKINLWRNMSDDLLPTGNSQLVVVIPGLWANDMSIGPLVSGLNKIGFNAHSWDLGWNHTKVHEKEDKLHERIDGLVARHEQKACLIGWSAGGIVALKFARDNPALVECVITLNTPYHDTPAPDYLTSRFERLESVHVHYHEGILKDLSPDVPITAIYGLDDLIVKGQNGVMSVEDLGHSCLRENIAITNSHFSVGYDIPTLGVIGDRINMSVSNNDWKPFCPK